MPGSLRVGIDIGSTTIKIVVLDEHSKIVFQQYARHFSDITAALQSMVGKAQRVLKQKLMSVMVTGSAGIGISQSLGLPFVQEVIAASTAIKNIIPYADTAIELGGEDAKITYFNGTVEQRMNGICAGGTGAFIDHMADLLSTDPLGLNELAKKFRTIHPIASRCGVFAKTDVQALMNDGAAKADIAASILQAVVNQTIGSLAQGRTISGKVAMLGGPLHFLSELRRRFVETLGLTPDQVLAPDSAAYFVALGAAMAPHPDPVPYELLRKKTVPRTVTSLIREGSLPPLFQHPEDYQEFIRRHQASRVPRTDLNNYCGEAFLGIDAGSTTMKLVLIDEHGRLLYSSYGSNQGKPLEAAITSLKQLYRQLPPKVKIASSAVTGYGEHYIKAALGVDIGEVETIAHLRAARQFAPSVTAVLDIGGQDMKSFCVHNGVIDSIVLNEACSSGCGSFIETFAHAIDMSIDEFARLGLEAKQPVDLGTRCTVFMNSKVKQAQKEGASVSDISAGISFSIVKNALFKVIRLKNASELGETIVVQGGTFYNDSVLRATEQILGREVIRPDIAGLMGAFGAALIAREQFTNGAGTKTSLLSQEALDKFSSRSSSHRCKWCGNHCLITSQLFSNGKKYHVGNRCERGIGKSKTTEELPNLYAYKYKRLFHYEPLPEAAAWRGTIGLPRVLNMYEDYPFWFTFFSQLGYRVILSAPSSRSLFEQGMDSIASDSLCYPAKLAHGHIQDLLNRGVHKIFYPCVPYNTQEQPQAVNCYNCPIVTSYPETVRANLAGLRDPAVIFYHPFLPLPQRTPLIKRLRQELVAEKITLHELSTAVDVAYKELNRYKEDIRHAGQAALYYMQKTNAKGVILAGRPYHIDPEIHHGLPELVQSLGLVILSEDSICHLGKIEQPLRVVDQWVYHSRLYAAAYYCLSQPNLEFIQINSFGCGLDAVTMDQVREILETQQKIYTTIKLDEINNLGTAKIRIRSLLATQNERRPQSIVLERNIHNTTSRAVIPSAEPKRILLAPQLSPVHFQFLSAAFAQVGFQLVVAPLPDKSAINEGLKYVNNDACYPAILAIGQLLRALQSGQYPPDRTSVLLSQTGGCCRASNYAALARKALQDAGFPQVPILIFGQQQPSQLTGSWSLLRNLIIGTLYGDLLMRLLYRVRPYEKTPGSAQALHDIWSVKCTHDLARGGSDHFSENVRAMVREFDALELTGPAKPRVGLVGEILVKYHPVANNNLVELLETEGAEVVVPDLMDFLLYCAYDGKVEYDFLAGTLLGKWKGSMFIKLAEYYRRPVRQALAASHRFSTPLAIEQLAKLAARHVSLGNVAGEGWLLTAEMIELIDSGVTNIICMQPFACLPNHITGKGILGELRRNYPNANIVPIDYDPGASEVNQLNRIKLMLAVAGDRHAQCN